MNRELLIKVKEAILANPDHFDMSSWLVPGHENTFGCGTAACIAGWAGLIAAGSNPARLYFYDSKWGRFEKIAIEGTKALDLSDDQHQALCYVGSWPVELRAEYDKAVAARDGKKAAAAAADRIDYFIKTDGD